MLPRRAQQGEREQVGGHRHLSPPLVRRRDRRAWVAHRATGPGVLQQHPEQLTLGLRGDRLRAGLRHHQLDAQRLRPGAQHLQGLRQAVRVGQEDAPPAGHPAGQSHRLGRRRGLVQQGCPGHRQPAEVGHHGLEVQQRLQPALRDLRLIGRVGGVPAGVFQQVPADHRRGDRAVVAESDHRGEQLVTGREPAQLGLRLLLGQRRRQVQPAVGDPGRQGSLGQVVQGCAADRAQHLLLLGGRRPDVAMGETHERGPPGLARSRAAVAVTGFPLCRRGIRGFRVTCLIRSVGLRGSGDVAPSASPGWLPGNLSRMRS